MGEPRLLLWRWLRWVRTEAEGELTGLLSHELHPSSGPWNAHLGGKEVGRQDQHYPSTVSQDVLEDVSSIV